MAGTDEDENSKLNFGSENNSVKRFYPAIDLYIAKNYVKPTLQAARPMALSLNKMEIKTDSFATSEPEKQPKRRTTRHSRKSADSATRKSIDSAELQSEFSSIFEKSEMLSCDREDFSRSLDDVIKEVDETFSERLIRLANERNLTNVEVYKRANLRRQLFSKIISNKDYQPKKNTAIVLALALHLNLDETKDFLSRAGYALSSSSKSDIIVKFFIENNYYIVPDIDQALYDHGQEPLSN